MKGYVEFEFDLPGALLAQLIEALDRLEPATLNVANLTEIPEEQGVYQLLLDEKLVYVGKTDAEAGLRRRLTRHARKVMHRIGLDPARVQFKAVRIYVFTAMDLESELIRHYGGVKSIAWNGSGFGSNDPGRERDTTAVKPKNFDFKYPVNIEQQVAFAIEDGESAAEALARLKEALPFNLRFQGEDGDDDGKKSRKPHPDLLSSPVPALSGPVSPKAAVEHIVAALPPGWQATGLRGYVILYKEAPRNNYPQAQIIAISQ